MRSNALRGSQGIKPTVKSRVFSGCSVKGAVIVIIIREEMPLPIPASPF